MDADWLRLCAAVLFVGIPLLAVAALRGKLTVPFAKLRPRSACKLVRIRERAVLTPQHSVHLLQVAGRSVLVGASPSGLRVLLQFTEVPASQTEPEA